MCINTTNIYYNILFCAQGILQKSEKILTSPVSLVYMTSNVVHVSWDPVMNKPDTRGNVEIKIILITFYSRYDVAGQRCYIHLAWHKALFVLFSISFF